MRLDVMDRVVLLGLLPQEADFLTLKLLRTVKENLSFDEKEHKALKFEVSQQGRTVWNSEADKKLPKKEILIGEIITALVVKALTKLNKEEKLKDEHVSLYELFIEDKPKSPKKAAKKSKK